MKMHYILLILLISLCSFSDDKVITINMPSNAPKEMASASQLFRTVRYLPLETTDDCLLGYCYIRKIQDFILAWDYDGCYLFSAKTGKFISKIGHKGDDPEAYFMTHRNFYNPYNQLLYFIGYNKDLVKYTLQGEFAGKIRIPESSYRGSTANVIDVLDESSLCAFFSNNNGRETKRIMLFDEKGKVKKMYPNTRIIKTNKDILLIPDGLFYRYQNKLYFKEEYIDTVYQVSGQQLQPKYVLNFAPYTIPYEKRYDYDDREVVTARSIYENDFYLMFYYYRYKVKYLGVYNKTTGKSTFYLYDKGIKDDLNNFMPISIYTANDDGSFIGYLYAPDVYKYVEKNKANMTGNLKSLKSISPDDNPVIVFME